MNELYVKKCPICRKDQYYKHKTHFNRAVKNNKLCQHCCKLGKSQSLATRKKLSEINKNRKRTKHSEETKQKISQKMTGRKISEDHRKKIIEGNIGKVVSEETKEKIRKSLVGTKHTDEHNKKIRLSTISLIQQNILDGGQLFPRYNKKACKYFDHLSQKNNWSLQHALNGGEYYIKNLGYWLDAYDEKRKIIVEYDENNHWHRKNINKDHKRIKSIIEYIKPSEFWLFNEKNNQLIKII